MPKLLFGQLYNHLYCIPQVCAVDSIFVGSTRCFYYCFLSQSHQWFDSTTMKHQQKNMVSGKMLARNQTNGKTAFRIIPCNVVHSSLLIHLHKNTHFLEVHPNPMYIQVYLPMQQFHQHCHQQL